MKKVFTLKLAIFILFLFGSVKVQSQDVLKSFINRNDFALRSVQKNSIRLGDNNNAAVVKAVLKLHLVSIKFYSSNIELSKQAALEARLQSLAFLEQKAGAPTVDFKIKDKEHAFFGNVPTVSADKYLSSEELQSIEAVDLHDPAAINTFITSLK
jgi:hypothetical protein